LVKNFLNDSTPAGVLNNPDKVFKFTGKLRSSATCYYNPKCTNEHHHEGMLWFGSGDTDRDGVIT
jgi:hypothetical protein